MTMLERLRVNAGWSPAQLGDIAQVSGMTVRRIEGGQVRHPNPATLKALADALHDALGVTVEPSRLLENAADRDEA